MKASKAQENGRLDKEIVTVEIPQRKKDPIQFSKDEFIKPSTSKEILAKLRPAFRKEGGSVTAGNSSGLNDGAAATIIAAATIDCGYDFRGLGLDFLSDNAGPDF